MFGGDVITKRKLDEVKDDLQAQIDDLKRSVERLTADNKKLREYVKEEVSGLWSETNRLDTEK